MLPRLVQNTLTTLRDLYTARHFHNPKKAPRYRGLYPTYEAALAALPKGELHGFEDESVPEYFEKYLLGFNTGDYPVLFWMQKTLVPGSTVFDFGGGLGQCFYGYQEFMQFPAGLRWTVCDVESQVKHGAKVAHERKAENLFFTTDTQQASGVTFFLTNGALQYVPEDLSAILAKLPELPQHLIVNRVPIYEGKPYYTVQSSLHSFVPHRVFNLQEFTGQIKNLGYELAGEWKLPRTLHVQFHPELFVDSFKGLYFRRTK